LFNRADDEFNALIFTVKKSAARLNEQIAFLQRRAARGGGGSQLRQHQQVMLDQLKRGALATTKRFQRLLHEHSSASKSRASRFSRFGQSGTSTFGRGGAENSLLAGGSVGGPASLAAPAHGSRERHGGMYPSYGVTGLRSRRPPAGAYVHAHRGPPRPGEGDAGVDNLLGDGKQPLLISRQAYRTERTREVEGVEKHIAELGQMFSKLTELVAASGETIEHIDDNIEAAVENVSQGQAELLKYLETVSKNRALILKVFAILICSIVFFMWFKA
jgi:syntaxin 5